ncbi:MAG: aminopeptidase [Proteobacteria bacterium]|nr:aminopeptidase [Pseudomonadota bacterium]
MTDPRVSELARIIINYSTRVRKGDTVVISSSGTGAIPLVKELHKRSLEQGAQYVHYHISVPEIARDFFNIASPEQVSYFPQHELDLMKKATVYIGIAAADNSMVLANAKQENMVLYTKTMKSIQDERVKHTRWLVTRFPTHSAAQDAKMSLEEFETFLFSACNINWQKEAKKQEELKKLMEKTDKVKLIASDTSLTFSIKDMPAIKCCGMRNLPDGEVFTAPVKDSIDGYITFNCPAIYQGKEYNSIRLRFKKGKIVEATSPGKNRELNKVLDTDDGSRYVGEFSLGVNPAIRFPMRNILFDEKISGSIHLAMGNSYDDCSNSNTSAIHWDMVKLLQGDGKIFFDGKLIQKDGKFVHPKLTSLNPK